MPCPQIFFENILCNENRKENANKGEPQINVVKPELIQVKFQIMDNDMYGTFKDYGGQPGKQPYEPGNNKQEIVVTDMFEAPYQKLDHYTVKSRFCLFCCHLISVPAKIKDWFA